MDELKSLQSISVGRFRVGPEQKRSQKDETFFRKVWKSLLVYFSQWDINDLGDRSESNKHIKGNGSALTRDHQRDFIQVPVRLD